LFNEKKTILKNIYSILDAGYSILDAGCSILDARAADGVLLVMKRHKMRRNQQKIAKKRAKK